MCVTSGTAEKKAMRSTITTLFSRLNLKRAREQKVGRGKAKAGKDGKAARVGREAGKGRQDLKARGASKARVGAAAEEADSKARVIIAENLDIVRGTAGRRALR